MAWKAYGDHDDLVVNVVGVWVANFPALVSTVLVVLTVLLFVVHCDLVSLLSVSVAHYGLLDEKGIQKGLKTFESFQSILSPL